MTWDTTLYLIAHNQVIASQSFKIKGEILACVRHALGARLAYLANLLVNIALFPLAIIFVTIGLIIALSHWNFRIEVYSKSFNWIKTKTNHILLSALGAALPSLAYRFRNANLAPYVIGLRIAVIAYGFFYALTR